MARAPPGRRGPSRRTHDLDHQRRQNLPAAEALPGAVQPRRCSRTRHPRGSSAAAATASLTRPARAQAVQLDAENDRVALPGRNRQRRREPWRQGPTPHNGPELSGFNAPAPSEHDTRPLSCALKSAAASSYAAASLAPHRGSATPAPGNDGGLVATGPVAHAPPSP